MSNTSRIILFVFISLTIGAVSYIATENYFLAGGVGVYFLLLTFIFFVPKLEKFNKLSERFEQCYHFINNFIISLSIKKAIAPALENTYLSMPLSFQDMYKGIENMNENEKIRYLNGNYFPFHIYRLFIQVIELYEEQGGDILEMSKYLLQECRLTEEYVNKATSLAKSKYLESGILWSITLSILVFLRFTLSDFYSSIKSQLIFIIPISLIFAFVGFSIYVLISRGTNIKVKGYDSHEKII